MRIRKKAISSLDKLKYIVKQIFVPICILHKILFYKITEREREGRFITQGWAWIIAYQVRFRLQIYFPNFESKVVLNCKVVGSMPSDKSQRST